MSTFTSPIEEMPFVQALLADASARGYITHDQILEGLPQVENNLALLEMILAKLQAAEVVIYQTEEDVATADDLVGGVNGIKGSNEPHAAPLHDLSNVPIDDSIGLYFREMGGQRLLTAEEEVQLAKEIEAGHEAEIILADPELDIDEFDEGERIKEIGEAARDLLIRANTRLVVSIAKKYRGYGLQFLDLIQEGNIGLMKAIEKYDYRLGNRFSTYATWWIRQSVSRSLANHGRTIRIPAHLIGRIRKLNQISQELEQELGRRPTPEEIANRLDLPSDQVRWLLRTGLHPVHLESPVGYESDAELGDFIEDIELPKPAETAAQNILAEEISGILDQLTPREAQILRLRYGLQDGEFRTLKELGEMFGLSRERIRQLEKEALRKLRLPDYAGHLRQFLR